MTILSIFLSVESVKNEFWACFAILLSQENSPGHQENRTECQENRPGHQENRKMTILSLVLSVWASAAILMSQENRTECQENRPGYQENRENDHSELSFECRISKKRILSMFCYSPEPGE